VGLKCKWGIFVFVLQMSASLCLFAKPQLKIFLGPHECPWTEKFSEEILQNPLFTEKVSADVDLCIYPFYEEKERDFYKIIEFPSLLFVSEENETLAALSYLPLEAEAYAHYVKEVAKFIALLKTERLADKNSEELEALYLHAQELKLIEQKKAILEIGLLNGGRNFFLLEKYAELLKNYKFKDPRIEKMRKKILLSDPENKQGTSLRLALIDFEAKERKEKRKKNAKSVVRPLLDYAKKFKGKDEQNLWHVEMKIADYFFEQGNKKAALRHAETALKIAPEPMKPFVQRAIRSFSTK
jgi:hypothetical protein